MEAVTDTALNDPGTLDNRLSLDPNDTRWSGTLEEWRDGNEYTVEVRIRQVSPGEFEVVGMTGGKSSEGMEDEEAPMSQEAEAAAPQVQNGYVNPAVQALIGARQRG